MHVPGLEEGNSKPDVGSDGCMSDGGGVAGGEAGRGQCSAWNWGGSREDRGLRASLWPRDMLAGHGGPAGGRGPHPASPGPPSGPRLEPGDLTWMSHTVSPPGPWEPPGQEVASAWGPAHVCPCSRGPSTLPPAGMCLPLAASQLGSRKVGFPVSDLGEPQGCRGNVGWRAFRKHK